MFKICRDERLLKYALNGYALPHLKRQILGSSVYLYDRTADPHSRKASYSFANPYVSIIFPIASSSFVKGKDCALSLSASSAFLTAKPNPAA